MFRKNLETVLYNLILQYKREPEKSQTNFSFGSSKYSVGPCNPLTVPVDKAGELRRRLQEANGEEVEQETVNEQGAEKEQSGIKWFAFWRKKKTNQKDDPKKKQTPSQYGLHSRKSQSEILSEVIRVFKVLQIQFEKASESTVRFSCIFPVAKLDQTSGDSFVTEKQVVMDMTMSALENDGFVLNFTLVSGRTSDARILFDALQDEAEL